jgi:hypothetical protein
MPGFNVNDFRSELVGDGARPNLFEVRLNFPPFAQNGGANGVASRKSTFMVKAAALPGSTVGMVTVPYFGREVKVAGNRTFADWSVTIINDEDFLIRNAMESWVRGINDNTTNIRNALATTSNQYGVDAQVIQYGKDGIERKQYRFIGMFPTDVSQIDLDWGSNDTIEEYTVNFAFQYWETIDRGVVPRLRIPALGV